jgi:predicted nucleic acid-binding protein
LTTVYERDAAEVAHRSANHEPQEFDLQDAVVPQQNLRLRPALGLSDCLLLEVARKAGHLPLGTSDRDLSKIAERL